MTKLDSKNVEAFGEALRKLCMYLPSETDEAIGKLVENVYMRFQREAERDARDMANGKQGE